MLGFWLYRRRPTASLSLHCIEQAFAYSAFALALSWAALLADRRCPCQSNPFSLFSVSSLRNTGFPLHLVLIMFRGWLPAEPSLFYACYAAASACCRLF
jgi:hypothetical protein